MHTAETSDAFRAAGRSLVTDRPTPATPTITGEARAFTFATIARIELRGILTEADIGPVTKTAGVVGFTVKTPGAGTFSVKVVEQLIADDV
jgi:hypothetical protein